MKHLVLFYSLLISFIASAQYCEPTSNCVDGDMIDKFTFNTISNNSSGCGSTSTGYVNTGMSTNVMMGSSYNFTVQSGPNWEQGFGIWIDFNGDEDFDDSGEQVYSSNGSSTLLLSGSIDIPTTANSGSTRMRVRSQYGQSFSANGSCQGITYGETEDYTIVIQSSNIPPEAKFSANTTSTCSGTVSFFDESNFSPNSWLWYFGDGNTSTNQNPSHTYTADGTYTVSLVVTNSFGSDSIAYSNYISVSLSNNTPTPASCTPNTTNAFSGFGITNFSFNTINNPSADANAGYEDFTCFRTDLLTGKYYPIDITLGTTAPHNVKVWIDYNSDGSFTSNELVIEEVNVSSISDSILIPDVVVLDSALRLRVAADFFQQAPPEACNSPENGQIEDYSVYIEENTNPPLANFSFSTELTCDGTVTFQDMSDNVPIFWFWDFGDGSTSSSENPTHTYSASGTYTVQLIATNSYGSDTATIIDAITVNFDGQVKAASCTPVTTSAFGGYGIYAVQLNEIDNATVGGTDSYMDYSCTDNTTLGLEGCYEITIRTGADNAEDVRVWVDYNDDSSFDSSELIFESYNKKLHTGTISFPTSGIVMDTPLRMRVTSDLIGSDLGPCDNPQWGQVEDYAIIISSTGVKPLADMSAELLDPCGSSVQFTDESCGGPTNWTWYFGDGLSSNQQNPLHNYGDPGTYDVTLIISNNNGYDTIWYPDFVVINSAFGGPVQPSCTPETSQLSQDLGIANVTFNTINHSTGMSEEGYQDYSCEQQTIVNNGQNIPITVKTGSIYPEDVYVWIDFNSDGIFANPELVFVSINKTQFHSGNVNIPNNLPFNVPMRMRVTSEYSQGSNISGCYPPTYGQVEDYTVIVQDFNGVPTANFSADSAEMCMGTVNFINTSTANATSFYWEFGDGNTSTAFNPTHTYSSPGLYTVRLVATNSAGSDAITRIGYIEYHSNCVHVSLDELVDSEPTLELYPNPTTGIVNVTFSQNKYNPINIVIYNSMGEEILRLNETTDYFTTQIDLFDFSKGIYFIGITTAEFQKVEKIILH